MSFMDEFNKGEKVETVEGGSQYTETAFKVKEVKIKEQMGKGYTAVLSLLLEVLDGEHKGLEFEQFQPLFENKNGELSNPVNKGYTTKDGTEKAASLAYDILDAGRDNKDDRFGLEFSIEQYKGLIFKMGFKVNGEYHFLETSYQKLKHAEYLAKQNEDPTKEVEMADSASQPIDEDSLPF